MLPSIIIGIGGTGRWVLTDIKRNILETNRGEFPDNVSLIGFDLTIEDSPEVARSVFNFKEGKQEKFTLDYTSQSTPEFYNFSQFWAKPLFSITGGKGKKYPYIYNWLKEDDAKSYKLAASELDNTDGAGQRRQTSRDSLFLHADGIYKKIRDAVFKVGGVLGVNKMQIFMVGSLAGGTGCGTFIDIAHLVHKAVQERGQTAMCLYDFLIIPRGFEAIAPSDDDRKLMEGNCFAAFREMHRFIVDYENPELSIDYSASLKGVSRGKVRLFDISYLIDGTTVAGESGSKIKHFKGTCPAIADYILLHITKGMTPLTINTNLISNIDAQIQPIGDPMDSQIYSTFGIYKYIFDVEEVKKTFAHKLAAEVLSHFLEPSPQGETEMKREIQDFMNGAKNTGFNRNLVNYLLEHPGSISPTKERLFSYLQFGSQDLPLPPLKLKDIQRTGLIRSIPMDQVKAQAESRAGIIIGKETDMASLTSTKRTYYGILNYYLQRHRENFAKLLKSAVVDILHQADGKGAIDHTEGVLSLLVADYEKFKGLINQAVSLLDIPGKVKRWSDKIESYIQGNKQKDYLKAKKQLEELNQQQLVIEYALKIAGEHQQLCQDFLQQIKVWTTTFQLGRDHVLGAYREHIKVRNDKEAIKVHQYVTEPEDRYEKRLYELILQETVPANEVETQLNGRLPHPNLHDIFSLFKWEFGHPEAEPNEIVCTLPGEFVPLNELRERSIEWNYNFVNNLLEKGQLQKMSDVSVMDILALKEEDPAQFAVNWNKNSSPLADFSPAEQLSGEIGEGKQRVPSDWKVTFASWNIPNPGKEFALKLREKFSNCSQYDDLHQIVQYQAKHFIKPRGFANLLSTQLTYRENVLRKYPAPFHIFLADKNAARYEAQFTKALNEEVRILRPEVISLLEDEDAIRDFTYAVAYHLLAQETIDRKSKYVYQAMVGRESQKVVLGEKLFEVAKKFTSHSPEATAVREDIKKKIDDLQTEKQQDLSGFVEELKKKFRDVKVKEEISLEEDLKRLMKLILWEEIDYWEGQNA